MTEYQVDGKIWTGYEADGQVWTRNEVNGTIWNVKVSISLPKNVDINLKNVEALDFMEWINFKKEFIPRGIRQETNYVISFESSNLAITSSNTLKAHRLTLNISKKSWFS